MVQAKLRRPKGKKINLCISVFSVVNIEALAILPRLLEGGSGLAQPLPFVGSEEGRETIEDEAVIVVQPQIGRASCRERV